MLASYYGFLDNYATNPRPGAPYVHAPSRRRFHPPPSFPTLASPIMAPELNLPGHIRTDRWDYPRQWSVRRQSPMTGPVGHQSITTRTPRFGTTATAATPAAAGNSSPPPSILLDPHHQPSASGFRSIGRTVAQSRYRLARPTHPMTDTIQDEDEPPDAILQTQPPNLTTASSGGVGTDDSHLEESWRLNLAGDLDDGGDVEEEDVQAVVGGAGVLGLIHQFQKVSNEGRSGGVGI